MPSFLGADTILIQPKTQNVTYGFEITVKSSVGAREGFLAYLTTVSGVDITAYKTADVNNRELPGGKIEVDDLIQSTPTVTDNIISVTMSYPTTNAFGYYKLTMELDISDSSIEEIDFNRIIVLDK